MQVNHLFLTSAELVVGAVAVEVVAFAELAAVRLCRIIPLPALTGTADAVAVVAADVRAVVFPAVGVQILGPDVVLAALARLPDASFVAPETQREVQSILNKKFYHKIILKQ